ncbi:MAG TPA: ketopantoate reductase family protein [Spirochaetia bacterium]|nr:ketopantoate reductase family protein [Spirochaetia bacterium]
MKIAVLGAGAVGSYYGGILCEAGHEVTLLARGAHLAAVRTNGLEVRTPERSFCVHPTVTDNHTEMEAVDFALVAVKNYSIGEIAPAARYLSEKSAIIVPLLNGVEAAAMLEKAGVAHRLLLGGLTTISVVRSSPGIVERKSPFQRVVIGELDGGDSVRAARLADALRACGVEAVVSADIRTELWRKFAFISTMAAVCGLSRSAIGPIRSTVRGRRLVERAVSEVVAVARTQGTAIDAGEEKRIVEFIYSLPESMKPSFLLDLESGGLTEIDDLCGAVSRLGAEAKIATPVHDVAAAALGAK